MKRHDSHVQEWLKLGVPKYPDFVTESDSESEWFFLEEIDDELLPIMWHWTTLQGFNNAIKTRSIRVEYDSPWYVRTICLRCGEEVSQCTCEPTPYCVECRISIVDCDC
jgi:hypothetical protein